jgi:hypothetical protein
VALPEKSFREPAPVDFVVNGGLRFVTNRAAALKKPFSEFHVFGDYRKARPEFFVKIADPRKTSLRMAMFAPVKVLIFASAASILRN